MGPLGVGVLALALGAVMPACALALLVPVLARVVPTAANHRGRPGFVRLALLGRRRSARLAGGATLCD